MGKVARNRDDFVTPEEKAKSATIANTVWIARKEHFGYGAPIAV